MNHSVCMHACIQMSCLKECCYFFMIVIMIVVIIIVVITIIDEDGQLPHSGHKSMCARLLVFHDD